MQRILTILGCQDLDCAILHVIFRRQSLWVDKWIILSQNQQEWHANLEIWSRLIGYVQLSECCSCDHQGVLSYCAIVARMTLIS